VGPCCSVPVGCGTAPRALWPGAAARPQANLQRLIGRRDLSGLPCGGEWVRALGLDRPSAYPARPATRRGPVRHTPAPGRLRVPDGRSARMSGSSGEVFERAHREAVTRRVGAHDTGGGNDHVRILAPAWCNSRGAARRPPPRRATTDHAPCPRSTPRSCMSAGRPGRPRHAPTHTGHSIGTRRNNP